MNQAFSRAISRGALLVLTLLAFAPGAEAAGSHFLIEPYSGVVFNHGFDRENAVGLESGALLAFGGKFKGFPPRFYLYFRFGQSFFGEDEVVALPHDAGGRVQRSYTTLMGGLRVVFPLWSNLRMNLETGVGEVFSRNHYAETGYGVDYQEDFTAVEMGAGLSYRLFHWLSLGVMYNYTFSAQEDRGDLIASIVGESNHGASVGWSRLVATLGFHF